MKTLTTFGFIPASILIIAGLITLSSYHENNFAFAQTDESEILVSDKLKQNPMAMRIIAEMEAQKQKYKELSEDSTPKFIPTKQQIDIEKNRKLSQEMLQADLDSMNKKYVDFTPKNAFEKFVEKLNETYHGIFRDQFDYMNAKVQLAIAAKNVVIENGGSYYEAQREYYKYASMPRLEMIDYIQELNIKYGFADKNIQENFDATGKLPRFEDDNDAPCYGCGDQNSDLSKTSQNIQFDPKSEIKFLQEQLSDLRQEFLLETEFEKKKLLVDSLNDTVKKIQDLTYS